MEEQLVCSATAAEAARARRSGRICLAVPILMMGSDAEGRYFSEETHTVVLSRYGAGIVSRNKLIPEQELTLRAVAANREVDVRVVGEIGRQGAQHRYGVAFMNGRENFWQMEFPPGPQSQDRPAMLALACSGCGELVELDDGEYEYDICAIHGGLARFCDECGMLTVWRQSTDWMPNATAARGERAKGRTRNKTGDPQGGGCAALGGAEPCDAGGADGKREAAEPGTREGELFCMRENRGFWPGGRAVHRHVTRRGEFPQSALL